MRTEEAERALTQLADVYNGLRTLHMSTGDERFYHQAEGIDLAVKTLRLDEVAFMKATLPAFTETASGAKWR